MSRVTVRERLSKRAAMKGRGLRWVCLNREDEHQKNSARATAKPIE